MPPKAQKKTGIFTLSDFNKRKARPQPVVKEPKRSRSTGGKRLNEVFDSLPTDDQVLNFHPSIPDPPKADFSESDDEELDAEELDDDDHEIIRESFENMQESDGESFDETVFINDTTKSDAFNTRRKRDRKNLFHLIRRTEFDAQKWAKVDEDDLGDIIPEDVGGYWELLPNANGEIDLPQDKDGNYIDRENGLLYKVLPPRRVMKKDKDGKVTEVVEKQEKIMVQSVKLQTKLAKS